MFFLRWESKKGAKKVRVGRHTAGVELAMWCLDSSRSSSRTKNERTGTGSSKSAQVSSKQLAPKHGVARQCCERGCRSGARVLSPLAGPDGCCEMCVCASERASERVSRFFFSHARRALSAGGQGRSLKQSGEYQRVPSTRKETTANG